MIPLMNTFLNDNLVKLLPNAQILLQPHTASKLGRLEEPTRGTPPMETLTSGISFFDETPNRLRRYS
jgi:hypothetical protein